jgi:rhodanese-related sulfurtransferase
LRKIPQRGDGRENPVELPKKPRHRRLALTAALILAGLAAVHAFAGCSGPPLSDPQKKAKVYQMYAGYKKEFPEVRDITPREVMQLLTEKKPVVLVDVRTAEEQQVSMLPGAVTSESFLRRLDHYRDHTIIGYCTISYRSGRLAQELRRQGITMRNLEGGLLAWLHEGGHVYARGLETRRVHVYGPSWDLAPASYDTVKGFEETGPR